jgi:nucleoid DNA-binding protein
MITKQQFGQELKDRLAKKQSMNQLAVWLHSVLNEIADRLIAGEDVKL